MISISSETIDATCNTGVGLTYAKDIITAHNGKIFVLKSEPRKTIIRVILPV